jgi:excisionase family DNA binding protein
MDKLLLTPMEAAAAIGVGRSTLYALLRTGRIESVRIGACRRIPAAAIEAYVAELRAGASDEVA